MHQLLTPPVKPEAPRAKQIRASHQGNGIKWMLLEHATGPFIGHTSVTFSQQHNIFAKRFMKSKFPGHFRIEGAQCKHSVYIVLAVTNEGFWMVSCVALNRCNTSDHPKTFIGYDKC